MDAASLQVVLVEAVLGGRLDALEPAASRLSGSSSWGSIVRGAPWRVLGPNGRLDVSASQAAYRRRLSNGADPRPWEPMGSSRWGETFDVITDHSSLATMQHYRAIMLSTDTIGSDLLASLGQYVQGGGFLIVNARQLPPRRKR